MESGNGNIYFNEDGTVKTSNMNYCIYLQSNIFNDNCENCLIQCGGANKQPFDPKSDYMI